MATANDIIKGAFGKTGIYQPEDSIPPESTTQALAALNDYLNSLNVKGAVFPTVSLTINQNVPIGDEHVRDLKWAMAGELASQWGKVMSPKDARDAMQADARFVAAHTVVPRMRSDAGLGRMPSRPWSSATGGSDVT